MPLTFFQLHKKKIQNDMNFYSNIAARHPKPSTTMQYTYGRRLQTIPEEPEEFELIPLPRPLPHPPGHPPSDAGREKVTWEDSAPRSKKWTMRSKMRSRLRRLRRWLFLQVNVGRAILRGNR
jgi:hypothetical protein